MALIARPVGVGPGDGPPRPPTPPAQVERAREVLRAGPWVALTGAGLSTESGIPDYRGPDAPRASPMMIADFLASPQNRQRYWARAFRGWAGMGQATPNAGHRALAEAEAAGLCRGVITQNVDGLHGAAGSRRLVELHGRIRDVVCLDCGALEPREITQARLAALNPGIDLAAEARVSIGHAELRPDGDARVDETADFVVAPCQRCGGVLKPDVVFFGESVPPARVAEAWRLWESGATLVSLGSSLTVMSGLRFVRRAVRQGRPVVVVNRGATRADDLAVTRVEGGVTEFLTGLRTEAVRGSVER